MSAESQCIGDLIHYLIYIQYIYIYILENVLDYIWSIFAEGGITICVVLQTVWGRLCAYSGRARLVQTTSRLPPSCTGVVPADRFVSYE